MLLLLACSTPPPCDRLVRALATCAEAHGAAPGAYEADTICATYGSEQATRWDAWYTCRAEVWERATCTTDEGWESALAAELCCAPPGAEPSSNPACS